MVLTIDTVVVSRLGISISEYCLLYLLYVDYKETIEITSEAILSLESKGFIKDQPEGIILRKKAIDLFKTEAIPVKSGDLEEFVEKCRNIFPQGVKSGSRLVRGDKLGCLSKLKGFKVKYPEYSQEDVLEALKIYVDLKRKTNYSMMVCLDYFIEKDKQSMLASYCEDLKLRGKQTEKGEIGKTKGI